MRAYVFSAVPSVRGVSPGLSVRTVVVMTHNLKVQMSPLALCGHWYTVAPRRKINKCPPFFIFGLASLLRSVAHVIWARCTVDLSFWDTKQLTVCCRTASFLVYLFLQNSGAASLHVFTWSVQQLNTFFGILGQIGCIYCDLLAPEKLFLCISVVL